MRDTIFICAVVLLNAGCVVNRETVYSGAGTMLAANGTSPVALPLALKVCDRPTLEVGPACHIPVRARQIYMGRGVAKKHTFLLAPGSEVACVIDDRALTIRNASGTEGQGGLIDAYLSGTDSAGKLTVIELHGSETEQHELWTTCERAPVDYGLEDGQTHIDESLTGGGGP